MYRPVIRSTGWPASTDSEPDLRSQYSYLSAFDCAAALLYMTQEIQSRESSYTKFNDLYKRMQET